MGMYEDLSAPMPKDAEQRTKGSETKKGYDTTGYGYQFVVNRLNEVCGLGGWDAQYRDEHVLQGKYSTGRDKWTVDVVCVLTLGSWKDGVWVSTARVEMPGGHESAEFPSARKGAYTNALKKAAGCFGIGKAAFEGTVDDDNQPLDETPGTTPAADSPPKEPPKDDSPYPPETKAYLASIIPLFVSDETRSQGRAYVKHVLGDRKTAKLTPPNKQNLEAIAKGDKTFIDGHLLDAPAQGTMDDSA